MLNRKMTPSEACYDMIREHEDFRSEAYLPTPNDVWTIGYGHTRGVRKGDICTIDDAEDWLRADVAPTVASIRREVKVPLTQNQFDALVSFIFNVGVAAFEESTLLRKLNAGDYHGAAEEFGRWNKQKGKVLAGLTKRRAFERNLFRMDVA